MTITPDDVLAVMPRGRAHGMTVRLLAFVIADRKMQAGDKGVSWGPGAQRKVRSAVESLRRDGHPICATPEDGYYLAETDDELSRTLAFLRARAMTSLVQIAQLRRVSLPTLMGQLQLELAGKCGDVATFEDDLL
jgi:hypothetical protein